MLLPRVALYFDGQIFKHDGAWSKGWLSLRSEFEVHRAILNPDSATDEQIISILEDSNASSALQNLQKKRD